MVALLLSGSTAGAQVPGASFELERMELNTGRGTLQVGSGELLAPSAWNVGLFGHYQLQPLVVRNGASQLARVRHRTSLLLAGSHGVLPWLEVGAQVPAVLWQRGADVSALALPAVSARGLGTPVLQARLGLLSRRREHPVDLSVDLGVGLPVGSSAALSRDPALRAHARAAAGWSWGPLHPSFDAGVLLRSAHPRIGATSSKQVPELRLGAGVALARRGWRGELSLRSAFASDARQPSIEALAGVRVPVATSWELSALVGPGLGNTPGTPAARALVGLTFRSEPPARLERLVEAFPALRLEHDTPDTLETVLSPSVEPVPTRELLPTGSPASTPPVLQAAVLFEPGHAELSGDLGPLRAVAQHVSRLSGALVIQLEGHVGQEAAELSDPLLPLRRAQSVARYLADRGVSMAHIRVRIADARTSTEPEERAHARRVEVRVSSGSAPRVEESP
ncbi:OmpA family protein [Myxococcus sp. K38C18041901]|uniref:OmpA family protein n=1 Tax=Myxococcus guangdongensis TaxID=2906760 RepID=UPI0020A71C2C|nr:OmpA family protein [Myxococcus guangdongensis]MCP3064790.1 OmpA family protein [Myxococcus guangdongensis]